MRLPESWASVRLTDVCELNPKLLPEERPDDATEVTFVPMSAVDENSGTINTHETRNYSEVAKGYTPFRPRDILFAKVTPCMENGKAAVVGELSNDLGFGSPEFHVLRPTEAILPEYLFHFIRQQGFRDWAASSFTGTGGLQRVPPEFFSRVKTPVPTLPEQEFITNLFIQTKSIVTAKDLIREKLDQLIHTTYWQYFSDWYSEGGLRDPVRISEYVADSQYGVSESTDESGTHAVLRMNSITNSGWLNLSDLKYADLSKKYIEATKLENGDLLFNRTNSKELVGKCAIWRETKGAFSFASYLVRLRLKEGMLPEYLWATLNSAYGKYRLFNSAKQAVSMANVSPTDLGRITVPLPPIELQEKFAKLVKQIEQLRGETLSKLPLYTELQNIVTQQALTGELTATWREENSALITKVVKERNALLHERGTKLTKPVSEAKPIKLKAEVTPPSRHWLSNELSEFQRRLLAAFHAYVANNNGQALLTEDQERFAEFCASDEVSEQLQAFGDNLNNRIGRSLSQLAALRLIAKITLPKLNQKSGEREYVKAFRPLREEELTRLSDIAALRKELGDTLE